MRGGVIAGIIVLLFALFEAALLTALGLSGLLTLNRGSGSGLGTASVVRVSLIAVAVLASIKMTHLKREFFYYRLAGLDFYHEWICYSEQDWAKDYVVEYDLCPKSIIMHHLLRGLETLQIAEATLIDNGLLLTANILRPVNGEPGLPDIDRYFGHGRIPGNQLFILRNLVSAALGLALYALITVGVMRLAQRA